MPDHPDNSNAPQDAAGAPTAPDIRKLLPRATIIGVVLIGMFVFFFVTPAHHPGPNGLPVAVAGQSPAAERVASRLASSDFDVIRVPDAAAARDAIDNRDAYGAFVGSGDSQRLLVATAASVPVAQTLENLAQSDGVSTVQDVKPIDSDDPRGVTLNLFVLALVITSIMGALLSIQMMPRLAALAPRVAGSAAVGVLGGVVAVSILKAEGALPGPFVAEVAVVALAVMAIALSSAGLIRLVGPAGAGLPFLILLMLGNPASGLASAPEMLPTPWHPLGSFLPPGALGSALRGVAYFDGAEVLGPMLVLAAFLALGVGLNVMASRRMARRFGAPASQPQAPAVAPPVPEPAM